MMKAVQRKFIALSAHIKKIEKAHISDLITHLKALERKRGRLTQEEYKTGNSQIEG